MGKKRKVQTFLQVCSQDIIKSGFYQVLLRFKLKLKTHTTDSTVSVFVQQKECQHGEAVCKNPSPPHDPAACRTFFSRKISQSLQFIEVWEAHVCTSLRVSPLHFDQAEVRIMTGPEQHPDSFLFQPFCFFAAVSGIIVLFIMTQFGPIFSCHTDVFRGIHGQLHDCKVFRSCCCNANPIITSPLSQLTDMMRLCWYSVIAFFFFWSNLLWYIVDKHLCFGFNYPKRLCQKFCGSSRCKFSNQTRAAEFFMQRRGFLKQLVQPFSICPVNLCSDLMLYK